MTEPTTDPQGPELQIRKVDVEDAGELLTLRRAAFVTEAQAYGDPNIPPLTQTLEELVADLRAPRVLTLGGWAGHRLVGSIRVQVADGKATLGRFAVAPDLQGMGIGTQMLLAVVPYLDDTVEEIWVSTGKDSVHSIALAGEGGYERQEDQLAGDLTYAYLRKIVGEAPAPA